MASLLDSAFGGAGVGSYLTGFTPQLMLGSFMFSLNTAAFQEFHRSVEHRWASQEVYGEHEVLHYCGIGKETITLPGVIYPSYRGGTGQIEKMRQLARGGKPLQLISASGGLLGKWVIESIEEKQSHHAALGLPRKQEFNLKLRNYESGVGFSELIRKIESLFG